MTTNPESSSSSGAKKRRREKEVGCSHAVNEDGGLLSGQRLPLRELNLLILLLNYYSEFVALTPDWFFFSEDELTFSDTSVALRMMRAQFPRIEQVSIPTNLSVVESILDILNTLKIAC